MHGENVNLKQEVQKLKKKEEKSETKVQQAQEQQMAAERALENLKHAVNIHLSANLLSGENCE